MTATMEKLRNDARRASVRASANARYREFFSR